MRRLLAAGVLALALAQPAYADLFVSGDVNPLKQTGDNPASRQFVFNLAGDGIVVLHPGQFSGFVTAPLSGALGDADIPHIALAYDAPVTANDLLGASLYLSYINDTGWSADEAALLKSFVRGGGHVLLAGDNNGFADVNAAINDLVAAMGSDLRIENDAIGDGIGGIATVMVDNAFTAGTLGLRYVSASRVVGGAPLYAAGDTPFIASDDLAAVPEPSTWALLILGFGVVGAGLRRRGLAAA
jgi:hypothetical protein